MPGERIPEWFDHQSRGPSISFWFRNKFPGKVLCLVIGPMDDDSGMLISKVIINGNKYFRGSGYFMMGMDHTYLFDLQIMEFEDNLYVPLENEWNHAEVTYEGLEETSTPKECGIHVFKQESSMKDIRFADPYAKRKLGNDRNSMESQNQQLLKKHRFVDMEVS